MGATMRVISMHKVTPAMEAGEKPSPELIQGMGKLMGDLRRNDALVDGAGLLPTATRVRVRLADGKRTLQKGPYSGENELVAAMLMLKLRNMDEAIDWATRYASVFGNASVEIGPVTEGWDLGLMAKPAGAPLRCLLLHKADADSEAGKPRPAPVTNALAKLVAEMQAAGVLLANERVRPSREGHRINVAAKKTTVVDGPFAESKEMIAGYVIMQAPSVAATNPWTTRFAEIIGDVEMDVLPLYEP
jgi:hypothetical protein